jgi:hypothetical protein
VRDAADLLRAEHLNLVVYMQRCANSLVREPHATGVRVAMP